MGFQLIKRAAATVAFVLPFAGTFAGTLAAQVTIRGILYDDARGTPIRGTVMLVDPATDAAVVHVSADSLGQFALNAGAGTYQLAAVFPGYTSVLSAPIPLANGERMTLRVPIAEQGDPQHHIGVVEHVRPDAAVQQRAEARRDATMDGFETRKRVGNGRQYDHRDFDKTSYRSLGEFLQTVAGLQVRDPNSTSSMQMARSVGFNTPGLTGSACHIGWFIDGHRMDIPGRTDSMTDGLGSIQLDAIEAVEVFRGLSEMPAEFAAPDLRCGAVAIWTKRG